MIYIFQGCGNICALPGKACEACGKACAQMKCDACKECFDVVGKGCKHFTERPLSSFVILSFILSAYQIYCCLGAMGYISEPPSTCEFPASDAFVDFDTWLLIELGFAGINLLFAPYFQCRVWSLINAKRYDSKYQLDSELQQSGYDVVPAEAVQDSFKEIFLQDFLVLAYVIILLGVAVISYLAKAWINTGTNCNKENYEGQVRDSGTYFFIAAAIYTFCWWCCTCCARSVRIEKDDNAIE